MKSVCSNKWCKSHYEKLESSNEQNVCPKCKSMDNELSSGVSWEDRNYEGSRFDGLPHVMDIKVNRYYK